MTTETAKHLAKLHRRARPVQRVPAEEIGTPRFPTAVASFFVNGLDWHEVARVIVPALERNEAAAQAEEIRRAARERRAPDHYCSTHLHDRGTHCTVTRCGFNPVLWELAEAEVMAAVAADNARRLAEYEAYRVACEQGVAVPPAV